MSEQGSDNQMTEQQTRQLEDRTRDELDAEQREEDLTAEQPVDGDG